MLQRRRREFDAKHSRAGILPYARRASRQDRELTFNDLVDQNRVLVGDAAEVREKVAHARERLHLTDLAGNFALGSLPDVPTATLRRFMEEVAPKVSGTQGNVVSLCAGFGASRSYQTRACFHSGQSFSGGENSGLHKTHLLNLLKSLKIA